MVEAPAPAPRAGRKVVAAALILLVASLVGALVSYLAWDGAGNEPATHGSSASGAHPELGLGHVHGLGVDPADGVLYAASHYGVFRLVEGATPLRVADRYQDTMGFTITGPNTFLGSGHPDLRENLPARLGLIESTDAAQNWTALSLAGKADFHTLHAVHGRVYGYDSTSGSLMVSTDRTRWETRSTRALRDFVVDPDDPDTLLATAESGLLRSTDGGQNWQGVTGAPRLTVLAWARPGSLYGITPDGRVHHSTDGGNVWTARGDIGGAPQAFTVDTRRAGETLYAAVAERGILASRDGGATFSVRYPGLES